MLVDILAIGSRGDVQPYVALGIGLRTAGYRVRMVTLGGFEDLVRDRGLDHLAIGESPQKVATTEAGRDWVENRSSAAGFLKGFVRVANTLIEDGIARYWRERRDIDVLIVSPMGLLIGCQIAEKLRIPLIQAQLAPPVLPTRYDWDGNRNLGTMVRAGWNVAIHSAFYFLIWSKLRHTTNAAREKVLQLPSLSLADVLRTKALKPAQLWGGYSSAVASIPPDWASWIHVTGYWFLNDLPRWAPPDQLVDFLGAGPPPVFVGFGSTPFPRPEETTRLVVRALTRAGRRGVLVAGGSGLATGQLSDEVFGVDSVPHDWLFSRVSAAVHHGGAGVTGAALRAGLPSVIVPVFADQPFWGERVFKLGAGPRPIPAQRLTEDALTDAIQATASREMIDRAGSLGERIRKEDGVGRAAEILHGYLNRGANQVKHQHAH